MTSSRAVAVAFLFGLLIGWFVVLAANALGALSPQVPWSAPIALLLAAGLVGILAYGTHQRIQVRRSFVEPHRAVSMLVLGKTAALAGALVAGGYLAFGLMFVGRWEADIPRERVIRSAVSVVSGIAMTVAGLLLERACKVPKSEDDEESDSPHR
nr:DUF3180 domain-containing protein [Microlunatus panaciterrae]